jgi:hypothetical protein
MAMALAAQAVGCGAQSENFDDRDWTKEHGLQQGPAWREVETLFSAEESDANRGEQALRGVRHDLTMRDKVKIDTHCSCLDVVIGPASDARFVWADSRPAINGENMIIAVRTMGTQCDQGAADRRPSIQGVDVDGANVTVVIEELSYDRPQALGAIIRKPSANGGLFVRASNKKLPYARSVGGKNLCKVETDERSHHQQIRSGRR